MSARGSTAAQASAITDIDRRSYVRLASDLAATCRAPGSVREVGWPGSVRDISLGGIGLVLTHCFQPGTNLAVELRDQTGAVRQVVRVRVVHATATSIGGNTCWLLGCSFEKPLTDEEFAALR